jgi:hypothetical protein
VPEIRDAHGPVPVEQNVFGPEIAVDYAAGVQESHRDGNSCGDFCDSVWPSPAGLIGGWRRETVGERSIPG